jgi:hypothetical protein
MVEGSGGRAREPEWWELEQVDEEYGVEEW